MTSVSVMGATLRPERSFDVGRLDVSSVANLPLGVTVMVRGQGHFLSCWLILLMLMKVLSVHHLQTRLLCP